MALDDLVDLLLGIVAPLGELGGDPTDQHHPLLLAGWDLGDGVVIDEHRQHLLLPGLERVIVRERRQAPILTEAPPGFVEPARHERVDARGATAFEPHEARVGQHRQVV